MLKATVGFNYGPDNTRVNEGDEVAPDFAAAKVVKFLRDRGVLVPVASSPASATTPADPPSTTTDEAQASTEAQEGDD